MKVKKYWPLAVGAVAICSLALLVTKSWVLVEGPNKESQVSVSKLPSFEQRFSFGPVIERVVNDEATGKDFFIDFDTGQVLSPPQKWPPGPNPFETWLQKSGVDAQGSVGGRGNIEGLACYDMIVIPIDNPSWDDPIKASYFQQFIRHGKTGSPVFMTTTGKLPVSYLFKTREGSQAVLQIIGFTDKGVKIRYKMVKEVAATEEGDVTVKVDKTDDGHND